MIKLLFLLPLVLCMGWILFLRSNNVPLKQGKKGFINILLGSTIVLGFLTLMFWLTQS